MCTACSVWHHSLVECSSSRPPVAAASTEAALAVAVPRAAATVAVDPGKIVMLLP